MGIETLYTPGPLQGHYTQEAAEAPKQGKPASGIRDDAASGLSDDVARKQRAHGRTGMIDDPETMDERELEAVMRERDWYPGDPEETLDDYIRVRNIPGLTMAQTERRLIDLGVNRKVQGRHGDLMEPKDRIGPFEGYRRDVLISARGRYYWTGDTDRAGRPVGCPFETGPNNEISRHHFENVRGLK